MFSSFQKRAERARMIASRLKTLFPKAAIGLCYANHLELLIAVMLSAQCTDKKVNEVTATLFQKYRTLANYLAADPAEFERDIRPTGFYKSKAKHILEAARTIAERFGGNVPRTMEALLSLPGVARKTANVVLGNAFGIVEGVVVDTHVRRFALKFELTRHTDPAKIEKDLMELLPQKEWFAFSHRLIEYGRAYCPARKHDCENHPLTLLYPRATKIWP